MVTSTITQVGGYMLNFSTPRSLPTKTVIHCCLQYLFKRGCHPTQVQLIGTELNNSGYNTYIVKVKVETQ